MTIAELHAGDLAVVRFGGRAYWVQVGARMTTKHTDPRKRVVHTMLLHKVDPVSLLQLAPGWSGNILTMPLSTEVVAVVDAFADQLRRLRELCLPRYAFRFDVRSDASDTDPMLRNHKSAHVAAHGQDDIPFASSEMGMDPSTIAKILRGDP